MQNKNFQTSPGILNRDHLDIKVETIKFISEIPSFTTPSTINIPILAKCNGEFFCLSGEEIIFNAINHNQETIHCIVEDHEENDDMIDLGFRKVGFRMVPEGGRCSYGERVRAIKYLEKLIDNNTKNIIVNSHGGDRRSGNFNSEGIDLAKMIGERLQLDRETVNCYLNYSRYLNDETLEFFAVEKAKKRFFEKAQIFKRKLIVELQKKLTSNEVITSQISAKMLTWYYSFIKTRCVTNPVETNSQSEQNISTTNCIEDEIQETDGAFEGKAATDNQLETQLSIVPKNPVVAAIADDVSTQIDAQARRVIMSLSRLLGEGVNNTTKYEIISQAVSDLLQISPTEKEVING